MPAKLVTYNSQNYAGTLGSSLPAAALETPHGKCKSRAANIKAAR